MGTPQRFLTDREFGMSATLNITLGVVDSCHLLHNLVIQGRNHCQIRIHPLKGEWEWFNTMVGFVFNIPALEVQGFKGAMTFGTIGVKSEWLSYSLI
jgi:hypothetical protein